jgi:AcrR family transcriptional regulator
MTATEDAGGGTSRLLSRELRRRSIVSGAARAFSTGGFEATSMEDIAEAAGVTKLIVYRHFESKEVLYLSIVTRVAERLRVEVDSAIGRGRRRGVIVPAFLTVAREDPDGFRLLWRHSAREPRFALHADRVRDASVSFAKVLLGPSIPDGSRLDWAAPMMVSFLVEAVLNWLDHGQPTDDQWFVDTASKSMAALVSTWTDQR